MFHLYEWPRAFPRLRWVRRKMNPRYWDWSAARLAQLIPAENLAEARLAGWSMIHGFATLIAQRSNPDATEEHPRDCQTLDGDRLGPAC